MIDLGRWQVKSVLTVWCNALFMVAQHLDVVAGVKKKSPFVCKRSILVETGHAFGVTHSVTHPDHRVSVMQNAAHHPSSTDDQAERDQIWHSSNDALARLLAYHRISLNVAVETAWTIVHALDALNRQMAALCRQTCRFCPDPCCIVDTVWFDFRDLLLFHLTGTPIPPCQPATELNEPCPFLGGHGCRLDYCVRPWMCVHYILSIPASPHS